jgi:hypothetical protein
VSMSVFALVRDVCVSGCDGAACLLSMVCAAHVLLGLHFTAGGCSVHACVSWRLRVCVGWGWGGVGGEVGWGP